MDTAIMKLSAVLRPCVGFIEPSINRFFDTYGGGLYKFLARHGIGVLVTRPDSAMQPRERVFWEEGQRRGVSIFGYRLFKGAALFMCASYKGKTIVYDTLPRPGVSTSAALEWMDDKNMCHKMFREHGIPMAKGGEAFLYSTARSLFHTLHAPVVVKPSRGSRSRHTTMHIENEDEFKKAFKKAKQISPWVMIEEELSGFVYRATVIGGKVIGVLRREPALVMGDGIHTVRQLVELENKDPKRHGPVFHMIQLYTEEHTKELARMGMNFNTVPREGERVLLSQKASRGLGGGATDVTDEIHPEIRAVCEKVARVLDDPLVGIDFITSDITQPFASTPRAGIIECNSAPFIDLHLFPLVGKERNTPGALWELIFPSLVQK